MLAGLLGPDVLLFACDARLPAVEATLSRGAAQARHPILLLPFSARLLHALPRLLHARCARTHNRPPPCRSPAATATGIAVKPPAAPALFLFAQGLRRQAVLQHVLHGAPLVAASYLLHSGVGAAWEELSFSVLVVSVAALVFGLPWLIVEFSQPRNMMPESLEAGVTYYPRRGAT